MEVPAFRIEQEGLGDDGERFALYVTTLTLGELREIVDVDTWSPDNPEGYQRPLEPRRRRDVAKYVMEQQGILPTSLLLGTRPEDDPAIEAIGFEEEDVVSLGKLAFPAGAKLWLIDGQHRYYGVNDAFERTGDDRLESYTFPVSILWGVDRFTEMTHFNLINTRQKKMSTDIVDRHLVQIQQRQGYKMLTQGARGEKEYLRATATKLVDRLNEEPGPWHERIAIPGVAGRDQGLVRQHAFVTSLDPFLKDSWVKGCNEDDQLRVLANFWAAAASVWPEAIAEPKAHRLQATVGIYSLHMVLPVIIHRCLEAQDLTPASIERALAAMDLPADFWHKEEGDPLTLGTGMSSIRALAQYLIDRLPAESRREVRI